MRKLSVKRKPIVLLLATVLLPLLACGGGDKPSTDETAQGAAKLWVQAAMSRNDARVKELSLSEFEEQAVRYAAELREHFEPGAQFAWGGSGKEGDDYAWTATAPGGVVFFKVREASPKQFRISDVATSW